MHGKRTSYEPLWNEAYRVAGDSTLAGVLAQARADERRLVDAASQACSDDILRQLVAQDIAAAQLLAHDGSLSMEEFAESCLSLRDGESTPKDRMLLRERARVAAHLASGAHLPHGVDSLCRLWEESVRGEMRIYEDGPGRLRTPDDHVPFSYRTYLFDVRPVPPELETIPAASVPAETDVLLEYLHDEVVPCEVRAFVTHWLVFRIHPFIDGNGRTARMLASSLLAQRYSLATCMAFVCVVQQHFFELCRLEEQAGLDGEGLAAVVRYDADCLLAAQQLAREWNA